MDRIGLLVLVLLVVSLVGLADDLMIPESYVAEETFPAALTNASGDEIAVTVARRKSVESIPFWAEYEVVGLDEDATVVWMIERPIPWEDPMTEEAEGRTARFVSPSNAWDHTVELRVYIGGDFYRWQEILDFPLHNLTEIRLDASQFGNGEIASTTWSASNGDLADETTFPIADPTATVTTLVSEWPNPLDLECSSKTADGIPVTYEIQALIYFKDGTPFPHRGTAGNFFESLSSDEMSETLDGLLATMRYIGLDTIVTSAVEFYGWPDEEGRFSIQPISQRDSRGYTARPDQLASLLDAVDAAGCEASFQLLAYPYWDDPDLMSEYPPYGGGPHVGFMTADGFLRSDEGFESFLTRYIPFFLLHPNARTVYLGAEMSDLDCCGGAAGQNSWLAVFGAYREQGVDAALSYACSVASEDDLRWKTSRLADRSATGIPIDELDSIGMTFYVPLAAYSGEDPSISVMFERGLSYLRDYLYPFHIRYGLPVSIADMYCYAFDDCSFAPVVWELSRPLDEVEQFRWTTAWLRAFSTANLWDTTPWISEICVGEYRMAPQSMTMGTGPIPDWAKAKAYTNPEFGRTWYAQLLRCFFRDCPLQ